MNDPIFDIIGGAETPVIDEGMPGTEGIQGGFEGGYALKLGEFYHMFPTERVGLAGEDRAYDRIRTRIGHWTSTDAFHWCRLGTLFESSGQYTRIPEDDPASDRRASLWAFMPVFDKVNNRWNGFYVAYTCNPDIWPVHCFGRIWRAVSNTAGIEGIGGPYVDVGIVMEPGLQTQAWEGRQGVDSFFPYRGGDKWYAFYGGAFPFQGSDRVNGVKGHWQVGLAVADHLAGPWRRLGEEINPVLSIHPTFVENPIVFRLDGGTLITLFDGGPDFLDLPNMFGYSLSNDGVHWSAASYFSVESKLSKWWMTMRTPLGLIAEGKGEYPIPFTAWKPGGRFHPVGVVKVKAK